MIYGSVNKRDAASASTSPKTGPYPLGSTHCHRPCTHGCALKALPQGASRFSFNDVILFTRHPATANALLYGK
jgi:hypothetical protein